MLEKVERAKKRHPVVWIIGSGVILLIDLISRLQTAAGMMGWAKNHLAVLRLHNVSWPSHSLIYVALGMFIVGLAELLWPDGKLVLNWLVAIDWQSSQLSIRNYESVPFFEVAVKIPEDGSILESHPIHNLQGNGDIASFGVTRQQLGNAAEIAAMHEKFLWIVRDSQGRIKEAGIPMRIGYTNRQGKIKNYDGFEIVLPFKDSSIRRRTKRPIFDRLRLRKR